MARRALITGIAGQDGSYLAELLLARGDEVTGLDRPGAFDSPNLDGMRGRFTAVDGDLLDAASLKGAIADARPDEIYHLAAPTFVPDSWDDPTQTMAAIAGGTGDGARRGARGRPAAARLGHELERDLRRRAAEPAGRGHADAPAHARTASRSSPRTASCARCASTTGCSRAAASPTTTSRRAARRTSSRARSRAGPRRSRSGCESELVLGDLDAARDWSDARDIVRGAALALRRRRARATTSSPAGARTPCASSCEAAFDGRRASRAAWSSGCAWTRRSCARRSRSCRSGTPPHARAALGWVPEIPFEQTIADMVAVDLAELRRYGLSSSRSARVISRISSSNVVFGFQPTPPAANIAASNDFIEITVSASNRATPCSNAPSTRL